MSKIKTAYKVTKVAGKAFKAGFKAKKGSNLTKASRAWKNAGIKNLARAKKAASAGKMGVADLYLKGAKKAAVNARVAAFDAGRVNRATSRIAKKGGVAKAALNAGKATRFGAEVGTGYIAGRAIGKKLGGKRKLTVKQKLALKKAQLASAMKRKRK